MGFFSKLLGMKDTAEEMKKLENAISMMRMGVFGYLSNKVYAPRFGKDEGALWAMAVLNTVDLFPPGNEQARTFYEKNEDQIWQEALQIKKYPILSGDTGGVSYIYFASIFYANAMRNNPNIDHAKKNAYSIRANELEERASQLGIFIPSHRNVCNSTDPFDVIDRIILVSPEVMKSCMSS